MIKRWLEITFVLIVIYLVLANAGAFAMAIMALTSGYAGAVRVLQGR